MLAYSVAAQPGSSAVGGTVTGDGGNAVAYDYLPCDLRDAAQVDMH